MPISLSYSAELQSNVSFNWAKSSELKWKSRLCEEGHKNAQNHNMKWGLVCPELAPEPQSWAHLPEPPVMFYMPNYVTFCQSTVLFWNQMPLIVSHMIRWKICLIDIILAELCTDTSGCFSLKLAIVTLPYIGRIQMPQLRSAPVWKWSWNAETKINHDSTKT